MGRRAWTFGSGGQLRQQFVGGEDVVGVGRSIDVVGGVHRLVAEGRGRVLDQRDMIAELLAKPAGRFDAGVGDHADQDDLLDPVLL